MWCMEGEKEIGWQKRVMCFRRSAAGGLSFEGSGG